MKRYKLYITDSIEELINVELICESNSLEEIKSAACTEVAKRHYSPNYWRYLAPPEGIFIDFGSWSKFFFIQGATVAQFLRE